MAYQKYRNQPTEIDGIRFHSKAEARRYSTLKMLERTGKLTNIRCQPKFAIRINTVHVCNVVLDFAYIDEQGNEVYEDVKGKDNALSKLKRKLVQAAYGIQVILPGKTKPGRVGRITV